MTAKDNAICLNLLETMSENESLQTMAHMIECGVLHSNIPPCCVAWFIFGHGKLTEKSKKVYDAMENLVFPGGYSPCPDCFKKYLKTGSFKKVKQCACECQCCGCERQRNPEGICRHGKKASKEEATA